MMAGSIGTGTIGRALGGLLAPGGHEVLPGSRDPCGTWRLLEKVGAVRAATYRELTDTGELLLYCVGREHHETVIERIGRFEDGIPVDYGKPETPDGRALAIGHGSSGAEEITRLVTGAVVVKAFNPEDAELLDRDRWTRETRPSVFYCTDDPAAGARGGKLIESCRRDAVDGGPLRNARYLGPLTRLMVELVRGQGWPSDGIVLGLTRQGVSPEAAR